MTEQQIKIGVVEGEISAMRTEPEGADNGWLLVYAPGAGSNMHDPFGRYLCRRLADGGALAVRFQFPYKEAGRSRPDPPRMLEATWRAVLDSLRGEGRRVIVSGRSMGGRIGSHIVAQGEAADALALFAYPLHPPGNPEKQRDEHLPSISVPTLFCSGSRDAFASPEELRAAAKKMRGSQVHIMEAADHGFAAPKSSGRTREEIWSEAAEALEGWSSVLSSQ
ncbi:MAG: alpha/beta family hydrolase [Dehalococcoidia bacterium]